MKNLRLWFLSALLACTAAFATVETGTYISDLNATYPAAGDSLTEGDDHLRWLKSAIKATFPNVTGAVTPTHTELNYVDGVTSAIQTQLDAKLAIANAGYTLGTPQATTSGTSFDFTGIPSTAKRIVVTMTGISTNGTSNFLIQLGDSGGVETNAYSGTTDGTAWSGTTGAVIVTGVQAARTYEAVCEVVMQSSSAFRWMVHCTTSHSNSTLSYGVGVKATSAALDRVRLTSASGDTFDAGSVNIVYQ